MSKIALVPQRSLLNLLVIQVDLKEKGVTYLMNCFQPIYIYIYVCITNPKGKMDIRKSWNKAYYCNSNMIQFWMSLQERREFIWEGAPCPVATTVPERDGKLSLDDDFLKLRFFKIVFNFKIILDSYTIIKS